MLIGISGAHRSGKTSLAKSFAEANSKEWTFHPHKTITFSKKNIVKELSLSERIDAQIEILENHKVFIDDLKAKGGNVIVDRTPLDFIVYLLCEVGMTSDLDHSSTIMRYIDDCLHYLNMNFNEIFMLNPLDIFVEEEGKPAKNIAYQTHFHFLMKGLFLDSRVNVKKRIIPYSDMQKRINDMALSGL